MKVVHELLYNVKHIFTLQQFNLYVFLCVHCTAYNVRDGLKWNQVMVAYIGVSAHNTLTHKRFE